MVGIVLEGEAAAEERQRLLEDGKEISVAVMELSSASRSASGSGKVQIREPALLLQG